MLFIFFDPDNSSLEDSIFGIILSIFVRTKVHLSQRYHKLNKILSFKFQSIENPF